MHDKGAITLRIPVIGAACAIVCAVAASPSAAADPEPVAAPHFNVGDSWVVDRTVQKGTSGFTRQRTDFTVDRVGSDSMVVGFKPDGAQTSPEEAMMGLDWSLRLLIDDEEKTTARPFNFPMKIGDQWTADWTDPRASGMQRSAHFHRVYKVIGWEDVSVPAGVFHALKIEAEGVGDVQVVVPAVAQSVAAAAPGGTATAAQTQSGGKALVHITTYAAIYYAPEVKHFVKLVEETYNASNIMTERGTEELASFKLAN
jgi:hypothetical protein